jgi:hypothetical protein
VTSYAVLWRHCGDDGHVRAGRLEVRADQIALHGGAGEEEVREQIALDQIADVNRVPPAERLSRLPSLQIDRRTGPPLLLAATAGFGALTEILEKLSSNIVG